MENNTNLCPLGAIIISLYKAVLIIALFVNITAFKEPMKRIFNFLVRDMAEFM